MKLIEVTDAGTLAEFHKLPFIIYNNDPYWIPHIKQDVDKVFDPKKNKLIAKGGEFIRWVLKDDTGTLIGRIAAFVNPDLANTFKQPTGGCGFFECINDQHASNKLFDAARDWLKGKGMQAMDGPINFGEKISFWGLLIENFEEHHAYAMNYNPPYYKDLFEDYGFQVYYEQYSFKRSMLEPAQPIFYRKYNQMKDNPDIHIRSIKGMPLKKVAEDFRSIYNDGWSDHDNFNPLTEEQVWENFQEMKPAIDTDIILLVYEKERPIAFYINLPELNQIFKYVNGDLNLIGKLKFAWHKWRKTPDIMLGLMFGVVRDWQGKGVEAAMIIHAEKHIVSMGNYTVTVLTWIGDFNPKMLKVTRNLGSTKYRTHATYRYLFDRKAEFERAPLIN